MKRLAAILVAMLSLAAPGTATARPVAESVTIRVRPAGIICTGVCPNFELTVSSDGWVIRRTNLGIDRRARVVRFRITPRQFARFRNALRVVRPFGEHRYTDPCDPETPEVAEYDVRWNGGGAAGRARGCFWDTALAEPLKRALGVIRISPNSGERVDRLGRDEWLRKRMAQDAAEQRAQSRSSSGAVETIRYERSEVAFCLVCSNFVLVVSSDGKGSLMIDRPAGRPDSTTPFRVSRAQFAEFRRRLAPYRPNGEREIEKEKGDGVSRSEDSTVDVRWTGGGPPGHLVYYFGWDFERLAAMRDAIAHAPEALDLPELRHPDDSLSH